MLFSCIDKVGKDYRLEFAGTSSTFFLDMDLDELKEMQETIRDFLFEEDEEKISVFENNHSV